MNLDLIKAWPFAPAAKHYRCEDTIAIAKAFGAGLPGPLQDADRLFIDHAELQALPALAVALADGEFWQRDPLAGLHWQHIVHAEEALTLHAPLPVEGQVVVNRQIDGVYDRGAGRGALFVERQVLSDAQGTPLATVQVRTIALSDGGFGGSPEPTRQRPAVPPRAPDVQVSLSSPIEPDTLFRLPAEFAVTTAGQGVMLRGVCAFGLACRGAVKALCDNQPARLRHLSVRYSGPLYTAEALRLDIWHVAAGRALMRLWAVQRDALVLNECLVEFDDARV